MSSSTVTAQKLANETNLQMTRETNELNRSLAEAQNELNYRMFNEQNQWNLEQWQRENEYNSPEQQVERYLKAGINPIWAISNGNPGNAQQLTSAEAKPAERAEMIAPHMEPEADPSRLTNIVAAARDVSNSALGFEKLRLDALDVDTRRAAQISRSSLDMASAANKAAATTQIQTQTQFDLDTFGVRVGQEQQKLANLKKQLENMDSQSEMYRAAAANYHATEDLTREKINRIAEDYQLKWREIRVAERNARSNEITAGAAASNADTNAKRLSLDENFARATVAKWNNDQLLDYLKNFSQNISGEMKAGVEVGGLGVSGKAGVSEKGLPTLTTFEAAGLRAIQWAAAEPDNPQAAEAARIAVETTNKIDNDMHVPLRVDPSQTSSSTSVLNPPPLESFGSWSSWQ